MEHLITNFDLIPTIKASQAILGEIRLENLLTTLIKILTQDSEVSIGHLLLASENGWCIEASSNLNRNNTEVLKSLPISDHLPISIINHVSLTQSTVVLNDAAYGPDFINDPYFKEHKPRTIFCAPLINQKIIGIVYLEGDATAGAFTAEKLQVLELLLKQAAIALENAKLYSKTLEELKTIQDKLIHCEKMASLGGMVAGVAHELRNPLSFVNSLSELSINLANELSDSLKLLFPKMAKENLQDVQDILNYLIHNSEEILKNGNRANDIIQLMLQHSRNESNSKQLANINELLEQAVKLSYHSMRAAKSDFRLTTNRQYDDSLPELVVSTQSLSRALINLIDNACHAMKKKKEQLKNVGIIFEPMLSLTTLNTPDAVEVHIRDNGTGIDAKDTKKVFEPFFTTKPPGEGTGLGLSLCHDTIVKEHQGKIDIDSKLNEYTKITVSLPKDNHPSEHSLIRR